MATINAEEARERHVRVVVSDGGNMASWYRISAVIRKDAERSITVARVETRRRPIRARCDVPIYRYIRGRVTR
jgi:hypothetical protein